MLMNSGILKKSTEREIEKLGPFAEKVADRWAVLPADRTLELEASGELLPYLKSRAKREAEVMSEARMGGEMSHLADHEIAELCGISMNEGPP